MSKNIQFQKYCSKNDCQMYILVTLRERGNRKPDLALCNSLNLDFTRR